MPDGRLLFNLALAVVFVTAASFNVSEAFGQYQLYRDARGLRGFMASITMFAGVMALVFGTFREAMPILRIGSAASVAVFLMGVLFSVYSWRQGR